MSALDPVTVTGVSLGPTELLVVLAILLLLFGSTRLPALARSLGQTAREFRRGERGDDEPGS